MVILIFSYSGLYNGNIAGIAWQTKVPAGLGLYTGLQSNACSYDKLNRLTLADYTTSGNSGKYNEALEYDVMGNITALRRNGGTAGSTYQNNFSYTYLLSGNPSNRLQSISDGGVEARSSSYSYDANGNLKADSYKGISDISYTYYTNLPQTVTRSGGTVSYVYDAAGRKLQKTVSGVTRDYINGIEYVNGSIESVATEEGRALPGSPYTYEYMLKDHLGNVRAT